MVGAILRAALASRAIRHASLCGFSTCESELIATSAIGCGVEWGRQSLQELSYVQLTIEIGVDNKCSMHPLEQGTGSFKRT